MIASTTTKLVMAVDDCVDVLAILNAIVVERGYRFLCARYGDQCLRLVKEIRPDLIFLDVDLPDVDGFELCRQIRAMPERAKTPIVFLTSYHTRENVKSAIEAGGNDFIAKPFDAKTIVSRINRWFVKASLDQIAPGLSSSIKSVVVGGQRLA